MPGHRVICNNCGREFDPTCERSVYDQPSQSYICSRCLVRPEAQTRKKPRSKAGNALRIIFGILFILTAFNSIGDGDGTWLTCLVIGAALLLWQFWPRLKDLLLRRQTRAAMEKQREELAAREAEARARELARKKECPHCGATSSGKVCEYCGMPLEED